MKHLSEFISAIVGCDCYDAKLTISQPSLEFVNGVHVPAYVHTKITFNATRELDKDQYGSLKIYCYSNIYAHSYEGCFLKGEETCKFFKDLAEAFSA